MSKCRTLSRPLLHNWNTHSQSIILRRWHSTAHTMTRRPACEALVLASSIPVNVIAFESIEHFNHPIASPSVCYAMPSLLQSMRSCRLWGSAHLKVNRKSRLASALCHPHLVVSEPCSESLVPALDLRCSCPTEPAYSTSEQPRQSTLTNQTQPETRQPASPSPHYVNHGATSQCPFFIRALYSSFRGAPIKVICVRIIVLCSRLCAVMRDPLQTLFHLIRVALPPFTKSFPLLHCRSVPLRALPQYCPF